MNLRRSDASEERSDELDDRERAIDAAIDAADQRDVAASARDRAARERDDSASLRDLVAQTHEDAGEPHDAQADREASAEDRQRATTHRYFAALDRDEAAGDRALLRPHELSGEWLVRVTFDDGESRYYKRLDSDEPGEFTFQPDDAHRCESASEAWDIGHRLNARYNRIRKVAVEQPPATSG